MELPVFEAGGSSTTALGVASKRLGWTVSALTYRSVITGPGASVGYKGVGGASVGSGASLARVASIADKEVLSSGIP